MTRISNVTCDWCTRETKIEDDDELEFGWHTVIKSIGEEEPEIREFCCEGCLVSYYE